MLPSPCQTGKTPVLWSDCSGCGAPRRFRPRGRIV